MKGSRAVPILFVRFRLKHWLARPGAATGAREPSLPPGFGPILSRLPHVASIAPDVRPAVDRFAGTRRGETVPPGIGRVGAVAINIGSHLGYPAPNVVRGSGFLDSTKTANDDNGHGTHVAGIIGARNTGAGVDDGNCGKTNNEPKHTAICVMYAFGVTVVASAGNTGKDFATQSPAAYPQVLTVTAMADTDGVAGGRGAAPGCSATDADDRATGHLAPGNGFVGDPAAPFPSRSHGPIVGSGDH